MIKALAFDYGGVIKINSGNLFDDIVKYLNITREEFNNEYFSLNHLFNVKGEKYEDVILLAVSKFNNSDQAKSHVLNLIQENYKKFNLNLELIQTIKELRERGYQIALLSNNSTQIKKSLIQDNIYKLFDVVIISAEVGYQKPQPEIFEILFKKLEVEPSQVIFIDDTPKSLENANSIGYIPVLYKNNHALKIELSKLLD